MSRPRIKRLSFRLHRKRAGERPENGHLHTVMCFRNIQHDDDDRAPDNWAESVPSCSVKPAVPQLSDPPFPIPFATFQARFTHRGPTGFSNSFAPHTQRPSLQEHFRKVENSLTPISSVHRYLPADFSGKI